MHWQASKAIEQLKGNVDTLIIVPNDRLLNVVGADTALQDAFLVADDVLRQGVQVREGGRERERERERERGRE